MAEGGRDFGYDERDRLLDHTDDQDDDDVGNAAAGGNESTGFQTPVASSSPQRQTTMNRPGEQPSFFEFPDIPGGFASTTFTAESELGFKTLGKKNS